MENSDFKLIINSYKSGESLEIDDRDIVEEYLREHIPEQLENRKIKNLKLFGEDSFFVSYSIFGLDDSKNKINIIDFSKLLNKDNKPKKNKEKSIVEKFIDTLPIFDDEQTEVIEKSVIEELHMDKPVVEEIIVENPIIEKPIVDEIIVSNTLEDLLKEKEDLYKRLRAIKIKELETKAIKGNIHRSVDIWLSEDEWREIDRLSAAKEIDSNYWISMRLHHYIGGKGSGLVKYKKKK